MSTIPTREEALFTDAIAQPPAERAAFLGRACGDDLALLGRIEARIAARQGSDGAKIPDRFNRLGLVLQRFHVFTRAGEDGFACTGLARLWPREDDIFVPGLGYLFKGVQHHAFCSFARKSKARDLRSARGTSAAGLFRPAASAGKITRCEGDVQLAGIEKRLAALLRPESQPARP